MAKIIFIFLLSLPEGSFTDPKMYKNSKAKLKYKEWPYILIIGMEIHITCFIKLKDHFGGKKNIMNPKTNKGIGLHVFVTCLSSRAIRLVGQRFDKVSIQKLVSRKLMTHI